MAGRVIFLHGASSSGKTTLARALQDRLETPFLHLSIDHLRDSGVLPQTTRDGGRFDWAALRAPFFDGFHRAVAGFAAAGNDVILEHILDTPGWAEDLKVQLAPFDVLFVGVTCPLDVLVAREATRGDRPVGSAAQDFSTVHTHRSYDLTVDGAGCVDDNVRKIVEGWQSGQRRSEFA